MILDKQKAIAVFDDYARHYDLNDPRVRLKYDHTFRVASLAYEIAGSIGLNEEERDFAWLSGLLHDFGRFEQLRIYHTFLDKESIDHAELSADLLFSGKIADFVRDCPKEMETVIRQHNKFRLKEGMSEREILFSNILRDADKIDILRVNVETPIEEIYQTPLSVIKRADISPDALEAFLGHSCLLRRPGLTVMDYMVGHFCLCYELVFPYSLREVMKQGYLFRLMSFESENEKTRESLERMRIYMKEWLFEQTGLE